MCGAAVSCRGMGSSLGRRLGKGGEWRRQVGGRGVGMFEIAVLQFFV
jgi:hypothetical protein